MNTTMNTTCYGSTARNNGHIFENKLVEKLNSDDSIRNEITNTINKKYKVNHNHNDMFVNVISQKKVKSIYNKKTTSKTDIMINFGQNFSYPVSVKMTDKGTQLQIVTIENFKKYMLYNDIDFPDNIHTSLQKFCGIIQPTQTELQSLNTNRNNRNKNKNRYWMNELSILEQNSVVDFLTKHRNKILTFILSDGMCVNDENKCELFILNEESYTNCGTIKPRLFHYDEFVNKFTGCVKITKQGGLQLNDMIGLQMKGSGKGSAYHSLQFKDRGYKNLFKD